MLDASQSGTCHFVGHALGGLVGLELALRRPDRVRSLTIVNGWAAAHAHTKRCFEMRLALLKHEGPAAYVRAQPIFLYPGRLAGAERRTRRAEEAHGLAGFQGAETLKRRIAAFAFDATSRLASLRACRRASSRRDDVLVPSLVSSGSRLPCRHRACTSCPGSARKRHQAGCLQRSAAGFPRSSRTTTNL